MSSSALCVLALIGMLTDPVGYAFFPRMEWFRIAGFLAFPVCCFLLSKEFARTENQRRIVFRLLLLALASEIPFDLLVFGRPLVFMEQSAAFSLLLSFCALSADSLFRGKTFLRIGSCFAFCLFSLLLRVSYGILGPLLCLCFARADTRPRRALAAFLIPLLYALILVACGASPARIRPMLAAPLSSVPIFTWNGRPAKRGKILPVLFCAVWPCHLLLLYLLRAARVVPPWFPY